MNPSDERYTRQMCRDAIARAKRDEINEAFPWEGEGDTAVRRKIWGQEIKKSGGRMKGRKSTARAVDYDSAAIDRFIYDHGYTNESFGKAVGLSAGTIELIRRAEYTSAPAVAKVEEFIRIYGRDVKPEVAQPPQAVVGYNKPSDVLAVVDGLLQRGPVEITMTFRVGA